MGTLGLPPAPRHAATARPLVIQGTDDLVPVEASREWAAALPRKPASWRSRGPGHHPYLETPKEFFPAAEAFLAGGWPAGAE